jgi:two-component system, OmpR family, sensor histidine kinase CiaH
MRDFEMTNLRSQVDSIKTPALFHYQETEILSEHRRNHSKYVGEGIIFFLLILVGAAFVYRSIRRQFNLQQQQQNFMMAITHELKTPISVTRLNLETLQKYNLDPEKQQKIIRNALDETARLNFLTTNILVAAQLENRGFKSSKEELDFCDLYTDCINDFKKRYPDRIFIVEIEPGCDLKGDALLLQMLVNNLLENAVKYSPKEAPVTASLKRFRSGIELKVIDEGPGIRDDEKSKIFSKFYRVGDESTRKTKGTGLGLYICCKIAKAHNGNITVTDNVPHGSIFTVIFKT